MISATTSPVSHEPRSPTAALRVSARLCGTSTRARAAAWALAASLVAIGPATAQPLQQLLASNGGPNDLFGFSLAQDRAAGWLVIGAPHDSPGGFVNEGSVYVYRLVGGSWVQHSQLIAPTPAANEYFGRSVAIHGLRIIVGCEGDSWNGLSTGEAVVFEYDTSLSQWVQTAVLRAPDGKATDNFGTCVEIHGDWAFASALEHDDVGMNAGAVFAFEKTGQTWTPRMELYASNPAPLAQFGSCVSTDGTRLLIGAALADGATSQSGRAYVFELNPNNQWVEVASFFPADGETGDLFGAEVALDANTAVVGAYARDDLGVNSGCAYVFELQNGSWTYTFKAVASDAAAQDQLTRSITLDGNRMLLGADLHGGVGAAYLYERQGSSWVEIGQLTAPVSQTGDSFGRAVSLENNYALVGAPGFMNSQGTVYAFDVSGLPQGCTPASAVSYGVACPGSNGVAPTLSLSAPPVISTTPLLTITNSFAPSQAPAVLLAGFQVASIPRLGCKVVLSPAVAVPLTLPVSVTSIILPLSVPNNPALCGQCVFLQVAEVNSTATNDASFSAGLQMVIGT